MPKSTKSTRKTNTSKVSKSPVRAARKNNKSTVFNKIRLRGRRQWIFLIVIVLTFGTIGSYLLYTSHANTSKLTPAQCKIRGRNGEFNDVSGRYTCFTTCRPHAGHWVGNRDGFGYCSAAISETISKTKCSSLRRKFVGAVGCARHWMQDAYPNKSVFVNALQCSHNGENYHVTNTYDHCGSGTNYTNGSIIVGSKPPVGAGWSGPSNCVLFIQWIVNIHSSKYDGAPMGAGGADVAGNMRATYGFKNVRAAYAVASWPRGYAGANGTYGHVALVDAVRSDGSIVVEESNWGDHYHSGRVVSASVANGLNYAYISDWE